MNPTNDAQHEALGWIAQLRAVEETSPWNLGPLTGSDGDWLAARIDEIQTAESMLLSNDILILTGETGVGKTSFVTAGLVPKLRAVGWMPFFFNEPDYSSLAEGSGPGAMGDFDEMLRPGYLREFKREFDTDGDMFAENSIPEARTTEFALFALSNIDKTMTPVIILDQFETFLMNMSPRGNRAFNGWLRRIGELRVKVIISLRSERAYLLPRNKGGRVGSMELEPLLTTPAITQIIARQRRSDGVCPLAPDNRRDIGALFEYYREQERPPSLTELNSVLYLEYWRREETHDSDEWTSATASAIVLAAQALDAVAAKKYALDRAKAAGEEQKAELMREAEALAADKITDLMTKVYFAVIQLKLDHCATALRAADPIRADIWVPLIREQIQRVTPLLATGDYKTARHLEDYFMDANEDELSMLHARLMDRIPPSLRNELTPGANPTWTHFYFTTLQEHRRQNDGANLLSLSRAEVEALLPTDGLGVDAFLEHGRGIEQRPPVGVDCRPWIDDPASVTSAMGMGLPPRHAIFELERCFLMATAWLATVRLARVSGTTMALIHDGVAKALDQWTENLPDLPDMAANSFSAVMGERFTWDGESKLSEDFMPEVAWPEPRITVEDDGGGLPYREATILVSSQERSDDGDNLPTAGQGSIRLRMFKAAETAPYPAPGHDGLPGQVQVVTNVRWPRNAIIEVDFRRTVFVNCDFSNTRFIQCHFEGTTFVNCTLEGAILDRCTVRGRAFGDPVSNLEDFLNTAEDKANRIKCIQPDGDLDDALAGTAYGTPAFAIEAPAAASLLSAFDRGTGSRWVFSRHVGVPAVARPEDFWQTTTVEGTRRWALSDEEGRPLPVGVIRQETFAPLGLTIIGGRISSLQFITPILESLGDPGRALMPTEAYIRVIYTAGANLSFSEADRLGVAIVGSALRGLDVTRPIDSATASSDQVAFRISVVGSMLIQTWIGSAIQGYMSAIDSTVGLLTNLSPKTFTVTLAESSAGLLTETWGMPGGLAEISRRILAPKRRKVDADFKETAFELKSNYRSDPATDDLTWVDHQHSDGQ